MKRLTVWWSLAAPEDVYHNVLKMGSLYESHPGRWHSKRGSRSSSPHNSIIHHFWRSLVKPKGCRYGAVARRGVLTPAEPNRRLPRKPMAFSQRDWGDLPASRPDLNDSLARHRGRFLTPLLGTQYGHANGPLALPNGARHPPSLGVRQQPRWIPGHT